MTGITSDGGYAEMIIAEARALALIPDELKSEDADEENELAMSRQGSVFGAWTIGVCNAGSDFCYALRCVRALPSLDHSNGAD